MKNGESKLKTIHAAMLGAAVGAAAIALTDKKTRAKLKAGISDFMEKGDTKLTNLKEKADEVKKTGRTRVRKELKKAEKKLAQGLSEGK